MNFKKIFIKNKKLLKDNFWLFTGFFLAGVFSYIYHFFMGRLLGPEDYGVLGALLAIIYLIAVFVQVIQLTITKMVSKFKAEQNFLKIKYLLGASLKRMFIFGFVFCIITIIFSPFIASFLKIKTLYLLFILGAYIVIVFLLAVARGILQGLQKFKPLGVNYITEAFTKLILGLGLVLLGYGIGGALGAFALASLIALGLAFFPIRLKNRMEKFNFSSFYSSSFKTLIVLASLTFIYSIDVILVKHFFNAVEAGYYAALSTLGKIIFFACYSVSYVMFSKISEYKKESKETRVLLYKSLFLVMIIGLPIVLVYFIFPEFSIVLLFGSAFLNIKSYLGLFGIFVLFFSLIYTISFYNLSMNKNKFIYFLIAFNILEVILIYLFHDTIMQIIYILLFLMLILLGIFLMGVFKHRTITYNPSI